MGGTITLVYSKVNQGSSFSITLPVATEAHRAAAPSASDKAAFLTDAQTGLSKPPPTTAMARLKACPQVAGGVASQCLCCIPGPYSVLYTHATEQELFLVLLVSSEVSVAL
jgi:hypothetical protein